MDSGSLPIKDENPSCSKSSDSPTKDKLFDPSIEMLINDFDDERTLEEEEALEAGEANDASAELSNLEKEGNMPLDELLALYGYNKENRESSSQSEEEDETQEAEKEEACEPVIEKERSPTPPKQSKLSLLYEPMTDDLDDSKNLTSVSKISEDEEDEEDEEQKIPPGVHSIMVGSDYQAQVPEGLTNYEQIPANDNDDKLLWNPQQVYSQEVEEYLKKAHELSQLAVPKGNVLRDDEEALFILQECGYNIPDAIKKLEERGPVSPKVPNGNEAKWSEEECRNFESGVRSFGKDFLQIQQHKKDFQHFHPCTVQSRSVGELVQFYYLWKKTERHDVFANKFRLDKKKYSIHPGLTEFMERFFEEEEKTNRKSPLTTVLGRPPEP